MERAHDQPRNGTSPPRAAHALPPALDARDEMLTRLAHRTPALFLDLDGTLAPIARRPDAIVLAAGAHAVLQRAADAGMPVAILSGRDVADLQRHIGVEGLWYAGCHGMDILAPDGRRLEAPGAEAARGALDDAAERLERALREVEGAWVERKRYAVAAHFREARPEQGAAVERLVAAAAREDGRLRATGGRKVAELRPAIDWDKGRALTHILAHAGGPAHVPIMVGDDLTDEDAFRAVDGNGVAVLVGAPQRATWAHYRVADPDETVRLIANLLGGP